MAPAPLGTILLVEDDHLLRRALRRLLAWEGYRVLDDYPAEQFATAGLVVLGAGSGGDRARERLDGMPGLEGLPLLVVGGGADVPDRLGGRSGPTAFLPQLFDGPQFLAAVRSILAANAWCVGEARAD